MVDVPVPPGYQWFQPPRRRTPPRGAWVKVRREGLALSKDARAMLGNPETIRVALNERAGALILVPCERTHPDGHVVQLNGYVSCHSLVTRLLAIGVALRSFAPLTRRNDGFAAAVLELIPSDRSSQPSERQLRKVS